MKQPTDLPPWAWWRRKTRDLNPRHAVRILRRAAALESLVFHPGPPLDRALRAHQTQHRNMGRNDRLLLGTALYALARNREPVRRSLPETPPGEGLHLLLAFLDAWGGDPGGIPHLPEGVAPWLRATERLAALRARWARTLEDQGAAACRDGDGPGAAALANLCSIPAWWLTEGPWPTLGDAVAELAALRRPQELTLRVQAHRAPRGKILRALKDLGIPARPTPRSPWGIRVEGRHNVLATDLYRSGEIEIQDEGSQLVASLCDPKPGERVLDFCAGGGGKTLALAAALGGRGTVIAYDADPRRLRDARHRARRARLGNIRVVEERAALGSLGPYDLVLVDAPCSSTGTLRRNPDVAWRWTPADLDRLTGLQAEILEDACSQVAPGGHLVYATCSLLEAENAAQTRQFCAAHPEFRLCPAGDRKGHGPLLDVPGADQGAFRLPGNLTGYTGDAFFLARFRRQT